MFGFDPNAVDDFLQADAARKKEREKDEEEEMRKAMEQVLFEDDDYDVQEPLNFMSSVTTSAASASVSVSVSLQRSIPM